MLAAPIGSRSIPAWAGETDEGKIIDWSGGVDPRVGGGDFTRQSPEQADIGRSPRGRGRLADLINESPNTRSIPAWAGETISAQDVIEIRAVDPRVGGGDVQLAFKYGRAQGRSPRGRGRQPELKGLAAPGRSIPAWAGETATYRVNKTRLTVDPRVGG